MKKIIQISLVFLSVLFFSNISQAAETSSDVKAAQSIIENFYAALKNKQVDQAVALVAPQFVGLTTTYNFVDKDKEVELIKNVDLKDYTLSDFKFSQSGDVIVATFKNASVGIRKGKKYSHQPIGRMMVLQKQNDKWLILAFANLTTYND